LPISFIPKVEIDSAIDPNLILDQYLPTEVPIDLSLGDPSIDITAYPQQFEPTIFMPEAGLASAVDITSNITNYQPIFASSLSEIDSGLDISITNMYLKPVGGDIFNAYIPITGKFITEAAVSAETHLSDIFSVNNLGAVGSVPFIAGSGTIAATMDKVAVYDLGCTGTAPFTAAKAISAIKNEFIADTLDIVGRAPFNATAYSAILNYTGAEIEIIGSVDTLATVNLSTSDNIISEIDINSAINIIPVAYSFNAISIANNIEITSAIDTPTILEQYSPEYLKPLTGIDGSIDSIIKNLTLFSPDTFKTNISGINTIFEACNISSNSALIRKTNISAIGSFDMQATLAAVLAPPVDLGFSTTTIDADLDLAQTLYSKAANFALSKTIINNPIYIESSIVDGEILTFKPVIYSENIELYNRFVVKDMLADMASFSLADNSGKFTAAFCYIIFAKLNDYQSNIYTLRSMGDSTLSELSVHRHSY